MQGCTGTARRFPRWPVGRGFRVLNKGRGFGVLNEGRWFRVLNEGKGFRVSIHENMQVWTKFIESKYSTGTARRFPRWPVGRGFRVLTEGRGFGVLNVGRGFGVSIDENMSYERILLQASIVLAVLAQHDDFQGGLWNRGSRVLFPTGSPFPVSNVATDFLGRVNLHFFCLWGIARYLP